jgi:DNA-binding XRE family transcriptional regulator
MLKGVRQGRMPSGHPLPKALPVIERVVPRSECATQDDPWRPAMDNATGVSADMPPAGLRPSGEADVVKDLDPGVSPRHHLGAEVRRAREETGMSQAELAKITGHDRTYVTKAETGDIDPSEAFAAGCDRAFPGRRGWFSRFWHDSHRWDHPYPAWFHDWVEKFERLAVILREWQPSIIPGLLQTADYARAILASWRRDSGDAVEVSVAARIDRQRILDGEGPPDLRVLLDESVLCREVGSAAVMHGQLEHLLGVARRPNVSVQVVPTAARAYLGLAGAFAIATLADGSQAAHLETGIQGMTIIDAKLVSQAAQMFDDLRDEALSRSRSLDLMAEVTDKWAHQLAAAGASPAIATPTVVTASKSATFAT